MSLCNFIYNNNLYCVRELQRIHTLSLASSEAVTSEESNAFVFKSRGSGIMVAILVIREMLGCCIGIQKTFRETKGGQDCSLFPSYIIYIYFLEETKRLVKVPQ
jgi:hypothetical protein